MTDWKIIDEGLPDPTFRPGGVSRTNRIVECPKCGHQFGQHVERGCFGGTEEPFCCPNCDYPSWDYYERMEKEKNES